MKKIHAASRLVHPIAILQFFVIGVVLLCHSAATAQVRTTDSTTATGLAPGSPSDSYALSGLDNVNLYNGNVDSYLLLRAIDGRGGAGYNMTLSVNTKGWRVRKTYDPISEDYKFSPTLYWWSGGSGYGPGILRGRQVALESAVSSCVHDAYGNPKPWPQYTLTRLTFTTPDGTEYELRDQATNGQPLYRTGCFTGASRGTVFVSADGTAMTFISDTAIVDYVGTTAQVISPSGFLMMRNGTHYRIDGGNVSWIRDRNGNRLTFDYSQGMVVTDSLNRQVTVEYNVTEAPYGMCNRITYKGFGGSQRVIRVSRDNLSNVLRAGYQIQTLAQLFPELNGASSSTHNPADMISSVWLPDGVRRYQFFYNSYGELARVVLPTGGAIEYDMAPGSGVFNDPGWTDWEIYRRVAEKRVYPDGGTGATYAERTVFNVTQNGPSDPRPWFSTVTVDHFNAGSTQVLAREKHYYNGSGLSSLFPVYGYPSDSRLTLYPAWTDSREYQTEAIDPSGAGTTVLRRSATTWQQRAPVAWWTGPADTAPPNDPRISDSTITIEPAGANLVAKQTFSFDDTVPFNNRADVYEYDYGPGGPGALVRRMHTDYLKINAVNGVDYTTTSVHVRSLPTQRQVFDAAGAEKSRTTYEYDNYTTDTYHAGLLDRLSISGFDSAFNTSYTTRGNVTATTRYLLGTPTTTISAYNQYDIAGNVIKIIDPRNCAITFDFADRFGTPDGEARSNPGPTSLAGQTSYAFPTLTTNCLGHTAYSQFDYYLGRPVDSEDVNGIVASGYYNDALDRPTQVRQALGTPVTNQTTFSYDDVNRVITTTSDLNTNNDNLLVSKVLYDGLGRTTETRQYEGGTNYIATQQQYDAMGRVFKTSNPFRPWQSESALWTTTVFDGISRVTSVTTPDNAVMTTSYSGNQVTMMDQIGKQRKSVTDALGRLKEVYEDPTGLNYLTSYEYDALDDLTKVTQGVQTRFFMYDSLKRLIRARNPEQDVYNGLNLTDPLTGNSQWSNGYQYDNNGNLTQKTDARGVTSTYVYDALNRNIMVDYSDTTGINPDITRVYDTATNGKGRLRESYAGGTETVGTNVEHTKIVSYDALGLPLDQRQRFKTNSVWSAEYPTQHGYNLAGGATTQTYPSGRTVTFNYDGAGRTNSVTGNLGDGVNRTYASGIVYSSLGGISQEQFGTTDTPIYNKLFYNSRGQLSEIRVGTTPNDEWWNRGAIINHYSNNCWGACWNQSMTDNNGNLKKQAVYIPDNEGISSYVVYTTWFNYDSLNRLQYANGERWASGPNVVSDYWKQTFMYDRYSNRRIDPNPAQTYGGGINNKDFTVSDLNNRLGVPGGQSGVMSYDNAGNLTNDTYTGAGNRTYDAENRITQAWGGNNQWQYYSYNADGERVRRKVNSKETWQIYGMDGELMTEYDANAVPGSAPLKEYGYRNGQLLITADQVNLALNKAATQSSTHHPTTPASKAVDGNTNGALWDGYASATNNSTNSWWQVDLGNVEAIGSIQVWGRTDGWFDHTTNYYVFVSDNPFTSTDLNTTLNQPGVSNYYVPGYSGTPGTVNANRTGRYVRVQLAGTNYLVLGEVKVLRNTADINWLVTDHLGTPRMVFDKTGSFTSVKRHDYLPFGEEISGYGGRTSAQGYIPDSIRQQFTQYERDSESMLDFAQARYYSSVQGRFTSADPLLESAEIAHPQSWNRYAYVENSPSNYTDPSGLKIGDFTSEEEARHESIINTGYDPSLGIYRGKVDLQYVPYSGGYSVSSTLDNPTPEELQQAMDSLVDSSDLLAGQGRGRDKKTSVGPVGNPHWRWRQTGPGRGKWEYVGPGSWAAGTGRPPRPRVTPAANVAIPRGFHRHHIFPQQFRSTFEARGINIDTMTVPLPAHIHRKLHPEWNLRWGNFLKNNPNASERDMYNFALDLMMEHHFHLYPVLPYRP